MAFTGEVYTGLSGNTATDLDVKSGLLIEVNDFAIVLEGGVAFLYKADNSGAALDSPNVILPITSPGSKAWKLQTPFVDSFPQALMLGGM